MPIADRVLETTTTTGSGTLTLNGAPAGRRSFIEAFGNGATVTFLTENSDGTQWELATGVITAAAPDTLTRATIIRSSNSNAAVSWATGTKKVSSVIHADMARFGAAGQIPTAGGTANALTVNYAPAVTKLVAGQRFVFKSGASDSTGAATLSINGIAATAIQSGGQALSSSIFIKANTIHEVFYDGTNFQLSRPEISSIKLVPFTASGTWTPSARMMYAIIECWGGGAGGGGIAGNAGQYGSAGGGQAGGYSRKMVTAPTAGASQTVTIGAGGAGGAAGFNNGGAGGDTSVGTLCVAKGGSSGLGSNGAGSSGGFSSTTGTGDITAAGQAGGTGNGNAGTGYSQTGGCGGSSLVGSGGRANGSFDGAANGEGGFGYASGGGGGACNNSVANASGGAGTAGYVLITEFLGG